MKVADISLYRTYRNARGEHRQVTAIIGKNVKFLVIKEGKGIGSNRKEGYTGEIMKESFAHWAVAYGSACNNDPLPTVAS